MKISTGANSPKRTSIREIYKDNFISEIKLMSSYLDEYNYIGMDTEFPGTCFKLSSYSQDFYYRSIKKNADELKLIQLGITLCNSKGEYPPECSTWQFNFHFDLKADTFAQDSITLLINSGINFELLKTKGIPHHLFAEYFIVSGLLLNPNIYWVSYHGSSDFAYLLRLALNTPLPKTDIEFTNTLALYFPNHFDIKILIHGKNQFKGGLNKLAQCLDIYRTGEVHQAGSDSVVTIELFFALMANKIISIEMINRLKNVIYGIGNGEDNKETINYIPFEDGALIMKNEYEQKVSANNAGYTINIMNAQQQQHQMQNSYGNYNISEPTTPTHTHGIKSNNSNHSQSYYPYMNYPKQSLNSSYNNGSNTNNMIIGNTPNKLSTSINGDNQSMQVDYLNTSAHQMNSNSNNIFQGYYPGYV